MFKLICCECGNEAEVTLKSLGINTMILAFNEKVDNIDNAPFEIGAGFGGEVSISCNQCGHSLIEK